MHSLWTPLPRTLKDYISAPKPNGYRSLHTTVLVGTQPLEVQIRTQAMHLVAEHGPAAHWAYKDSSVSLPWLQIIRQWQVQVDSAPEFMQLVRQELLGTRVFVFLRDGKILNLSRGATVIDAAFQIHTEVGQHLEAGAAAAEDLVGHRLGLGGHEAKCERHQHGRADAHEGQRRLRPCRAANAP